jgi:hypothetical protein
VGSEHPIECFGFWFSRAVSKQLWQALFFKTTTLYPGWI